jgi:hypothetical protein
VGTYTVNALVQDSNYDGSAAGTLTVTGPAYDDWIRIHLADPELPELLLKDSDPDGDGLSNLVEYALGSDPSASTAHPLSAVISATGPVLVPCQKALPGTSIVVEYSEDLSGWDELPVTLLDGGEDMDMIQIGTGWRGGSQAYLRLRVEALTAP